MPFKISNITNTLNSKHVNYNKTVGVMGHSISPGQSIIIDSKVIDISIRRLQLEGKLTITHMSDLELKILNKPKNITPKPSSTPKKIIKPVIKKSIIKKEVVEKEYGYLFEQELGKKEPVKKKRGRKKKIPTN